MPDPSESRSRDVYPDSETVASERADRMIPILGVAIGFVFVTMLSVLLYFVVTGAINPPAPRTAYEARISTLESVIQTEPENGGAWSDYIRAWTGVQDYESAGKAWQDATEVLEGRPDQLIQVDLAWAQSLMLQNRYAEAIEQAQVVIDSEDEAQAVLVENLGLRAELGIAGTGTLVPAHVLQGGSYAALEEWEQAVDAFSEALALAPVAADVLVSRGRAYLELGMEAEARADFETAAQFIPEDPTIKEFLEGAGEAQ